MPTGRQMRVEGAAGNPKLYGNVMWGGAVQGTGGSTAIPSSWDRYRQAGAAARAMLVQAAAETWRVPAGEVQVENGVVSHASGGQASFGELAATAAQLTPAGAAEAQAPRRMAADRQSRPCGGWIRLAKTTRHADLHHRRAAARHADGGGEHIRRRSAAR